MPGCASLFPLPASRALLALLASAALPLAAAAQAPRPDSTLSQFSRLKAEQLLRDHLPCLGCHTLNGEGGNIGPDLSTVRQRRSPEYIAAMIADPQRVVPGSVMPRTLMPDKTRLLITRYLSSLPGTATGGVPEPRAPIAPVNDGAELYARWCAACHGTTGKGDGTAAKLLPVPPARHASREEMSGRPDDSLFDTIAGGGAIMGRSPRMPAFGATLSTPQIHALVRYIRQLCRCEGPDWSRPPGGVR